MWVVALIAGSIPRNGFADFIVILLVLAITEACAFALVLGRNGLHQCRRDQALHGKTLAVIGVVLGLVAGLPALLLSWGALIMVVGSNVALGSLLWLGFIAGLSYGCKMMDGQLQGDAEVKTSEHSKID